MYWLRPETAIWRTLDILLLKKITFSKPILDIGCGDGIFTFSAFDGTVGSDYDVYRTMKNTGKFFYGVDIHDQSNNVIPKIIKKSKVKIDYGLDWKINLLKKAKNLKNYEKLIKHDANSILPFNDKKFETIFSNTFYWMNDINHIINESKRVCSDTGKIIIFLPDKKFKNSLILNQFFSKNDRWAQMLDRGISNNIQHCYTFSEWKKIFSNCNLKIKSHYNYGSEKLVKFWSIGLRPYSPYLIEMSNNLNLTTRTKIKRKLIRDLGPLIESYISHELNLIGNNNNCFHLFVLEK